MNFKSQNIILNESSPKVIIKVPRIIQTLPSGTRGDLRIEDYAYGYSLKVSFDPSYLKRMDELNLYINGVPLLLDDEGRMVSKHLLYPNLTENFFLISMRGRSAEVAFRLSVNLIVTIGEANPYEYTDKTQSNHTLNSLAKHVEEGTIRYTPNYHLSKEEDLTSLFNDNYIADKFVYHVVSSGEKEVFSTSSEEIQPYYGDPFQSVMLLRTSPKLTGNVKLTVDSSGKMSIDTFPINPLLASRLYSSNSVSGMGVYGDDIRRLFATIPNGVFYDIPSNETAQERTKESGGIDTTYMYGGTTNTNPTHKEGFVYLAPLYIKEKLPDFFAVFSIPTKDMNFIDAQREGIVPFVMKRGRLVKSWSMKQGTLLGDYLRRHSEEAIRQPSPFLLQPSVEDGENVFRGVSVKSGLFSGATELNYRPYMEARKNTYSTETYSKNISGICERNELVHPHIINMEYYFDDTEVDTLSLNTYFGLYLTEDNIVSYEMITNQSDGNARCYKKIGEEGVDNDLYKHASSLTDQEVIYGLSSGSELVRVRTEDDLKKEITAGSISKNKDVKASFRISSLTISRCKEFLTMSFGEAYREGTHLRFLFSKEGEYLRRLVSNVIQEREAPPVILDLVVSKEKYKEGVSHVLRTSMHANNFAQRLLAPKSMSEEQSEIDAKAIYYMVHKDDISFITNDVLVNDNHGAKHQFNYFSGFKGQKKEDYIGGLKILHTPFQDQYTVPSDIPNMYLYKAKIDYNRRKSQNTAPYTFPPDSHSYEDDIIVYHISITETDDTNLFVKRVKEALARVRKEAGEELFEMVDNGDKRIDLLSGHQGTYVQVVYPDDEPREYVHTFFGQVSFTPKVSLYKDSINTSPSSNIYFKRDSRKVSYILGNSDFQNMGDRYQQCIGFLPMSNDLAEVKEMPTKINELVPLDGWVSICEGDLSLSKDFTFISLNQEVGKSKALAPNGDILDVELASLSFDTFKSKAIISPFSKDRSIVYNGGGKCENPRYINFYGSYPIHLSRMIVHPFSDVVGPAYEEVGLQPLSSPYAMRFPSGSKVVPSKSMKTFRVYKVVNGNIDGVPSQLFSTFPPSVFEHVKGELQKRNIPNYYNAELSFTTDTEVVELGPDLVPLQQTEDALLSACFRGGFISETPDKTALLTDKEFAFKNIGLYEENNGVLGEHKETKEHVIQTIDTELVVKVSGKSMSIYDYINRYGDTSIFDRVFNKSISYTHGIYQPSSETLQFFIDDSLATVSVKGNLKSKIPLSELSRCAVAIIGVSSGSPFPEVIIDRFLGRVYILVSATQTSSRLGSTIIQGEEKDKYAIPSSFYIDPSHRRTSNIPFNGDVLEGMDTYSSSGTLTQGANTLIQEWERGFLYLGLSKAKLDKYRLSIPSSNIPNAMLNARGVMATKPFIPYSVINNYGNLHSSMAVVDTFSKDMKVSEVLALIESSTIKISIRNKEHLEEYITNAGDFSISITKLGEQGALNRTIGHYDVLLSSVLSHKDRSNGESVGSLGTFCSFVLKTKRDDTTEVVRTQDIQVLSPSPTQNAGLKMGLSSKKMMNSDGFAIKGKDGMTIFLDEWIIGDDLSFNIATEQSGGKQIEKLKIECNLTKGAFNALRRHKVFSGELDWVMTEEEKNKYIYTFISKYLSLKDSLDVMVYARTRETSDDSSVLLSKKENGMSPLTNVSTSISEVNNNYIYTIEIPDIDDRRFFVSVGIGSIIG